MSFDPFNFSRPAEPHAIQPAWDPPPGEPGANIPPRPRDRVWLHVLLFVLTIGTTVVVGAGHYASFIGDLGAGDVDMTLGQLLVRGAWYAGTILAILGTHEFGHYAACRYYGVNASLPYFLPAPLILTGTLGAFIRIRDPIPTKPMLFDIGVAGPIAGFVVAVPALFVGLSLSRVVELPPDFSGLSLGEPLLFQAAVWLLWGSTPDGYSLNLHPMAFAAWFGLLATALNLFPIGQLDGGHISYAALGSRSTQLTIGMVGIVVVLTFFSLSWLVWAALMVGMLIFFGPRHPRTLDDHVPLDPTRRWIAVAAAVIFVLCFTPSPIEPFDVLE